MTAMNQTWIEEFAKLLNIKFGGSLEGRWFEAEAGHAAGRVTVTVTLRNKDDSYYYPVSAMTAGGGDAGMGEVSSASAIPGPVLPAGAGTVSEAALLEAAHPLLDFIESYFEEFFAADEQVFLPIDWSPFNAHGKSILAKGQILNRMLEAWADRILDGKATS